MTNLVKYMDQNKKIQEAIVSFIDDDTEEDSFVDFQKIYINKKIGENKHDLRLLLHFIMKIANNHYHSINFFEKIEKILLLLKDDMDGNFSNEEIFHISQSNKRITLFLIENKIIKIDHQIKNLILMNRHRDPHYLHYFYLDIKDLLNIKDKNEIEKDIKEYLEDEESFEINRKIGENHKYICKLIRNDSVEEFITYVTKNIISLNTRIEPSIFETNRFLIKNKPNLIEYAAFFGSIEIFKYLYFNQNDLLKPSLWNYVIHGRNYELIHFLEDNHVQTIDKQYSSILCESIKCHHNEIVNYFLDNFVDENQKDSSFFSSILKSYNFSYYPKDLDNSFFFFHLCKTDHYKIVCYFQNSSNANINFKTILNFLIFNEI